MAKGSIAKANVISQLKSTFGEDFTAEIGSKIYINQKEGGETVQICLSLTCPKTMVGKTAQTSSAPAAWDIPTEITKEEQDNINRLSSLLNI